MAPLPMGDPVTMAVGLCAAFGAYLVGSVIYNLFLSPLRGFPGPLLHRATPLARAYRLVRGELPFHVAALHARYGPVVRIAPGELAYADARAWRDICGHRAPGGPPEMPKHEPFYRAFDHLPRNLLTAGREEHAALRRQLAHGFSERSMRGQEPIIGAYVDLLVRRLREAGTAPDGESRPLNMREWLNYATFDIIGDLGFGPPGFGCLQRADYHPWVRLITDSIREGAWVQALAGCGLRRPLAWLARRGALARKGAAHRAIVREKLLQRMALGEDARPDLIEGLLRKREELRLDLGKLSMTASLLIIAGSETTATLLSGACFLLATHPAALRRLVAEVRAAFSSDEEITLLSVGRLAYMLAVLNESLRHYPPVAGGMPRQVPEGGATIAGRFVPEGTAVAVWQWAINHSPEYFTSPQDFVPERYLDDPRFKGDHLEAAQPFSVGPRNCIGRNLAFAEMRLILAKIVYNFDMTIDDSSRGWLTKQKAFVLWEKPDLNIYLKPVVR
ncbi:cytochrome P450 [Xylariomycetidae sp. FL0641]|nr:cytochrome P450 [Xylariomycetidae sp. FL0641]